MENIFAQGEVSATPMKNQQQHMFHDFLAGDSPEYSPDSSVSDCESSVTGSSSSSSSRKRRRNDSVFSDGLVTELPEGERIYEVIRRRFLSCLGQIGNKTRVFWIHRMNWSSLSAQARLQSFQIHSRAVAYKHGGSPNVKFAWYGNTKHKIQQIISHGFSHKEVEGNSNGAIFLSPDDSPLDSVENSIADEDGMRHVLLCRVILGRSEFVPPGSDQTHPSSDEFDSGVDAFQNPKKYIVWSTNMNTHILPEYVVSFKAPPSLKGSSRMEKDMKMPTSPWISFPALISVLGRYLPQNAISLINKYHNDYKEKRIPRLELIQKVRQIAGDKLLIAVIKSCRDAKELKMSMGFLRNRKY